MPDITQIPQDFHDAVEQGKLPANRIGPLLDEYVSQHLLQEVRAGRLGRQQAMAEFDRIRKEQMTGQRMLERQAFRKGIFVHAPTGPVGAGASAAFTVAPTKWISDWLGHPMSWKQAINLGLGPASLPFSAMFEAGMGAIAPFSDPLYQRGERGYFGSLAEGAKARGERFAQAGEETRKNYGIMGVPIQAAQNLFNPLAGIGFTGSEIYKSMYGPTAEELSVQAERDLSKYLGG